jgi:hypothetical protein
MNNVIEFSQAKKVNIYDQHGNLIKGHKAVVNKNDDEQVYSVVTDSYKVVQHDEVIDTIEKSLKNLNLHYEKKVSELNEGARIRVEMIFPEIQIDLGNGDVSRFRATFDNSYDCSTGLRLDIGAFRLICTNGLYVGEKWGSYYHKHSKGLSIGMLEKSVKKGVEVFQTKVKGMFEDMAQHGITPMQARSFLDDCLEKKLIANKYLEGMKNRLDFGADVEIISEGQVNSKWFLYNLISEELTHKCSSIDVQRRYSQIMNAQLNRVFPQTATTQLVA